MNPRRRSNLARNFLTPDGVFPERRSGEDRRKQQTPLLSRYLLIGRRKITRRKIDRQAVHSRNLRRSGRLLALMIICPGILDTFFVFKLLGQGALVVSPFINFCLRVGWGYCLLVKFLLISIALFAILLHQNFFRMERVLGSIYVVYTLLGVYQVLSLFSVFMRG